MEVYLVDGTYELFRHYYALPGARDASGQEVGATRGVVASIGGMVKSGVTHIGVATDHVIESFRNDLWPGYKTGAGIPHDLRSQFTLLEDALTALGVTVWRMVEFEADDALAAAAEIAANDARVSRVVICTPDKDLAQCVRGTRVVQVDRRGKEIRDADAVRGKFGVPPELIPDFLALVGDAQDGYPGVRGIGRVTAARLLHEHGPIESLPANVLGDDREQALLFKRLATLRADAPLFEDVEELRWRGPTEGFDAWVAKIGDEKLGERCRKAATVVAA